MPYPLTTAVLIGLFSTVHCLGMCGGIMGALASSLPAEAQAVRARRWTYLGAFNLGRLASYTLAGAVLGTLGRGLHEFLSPRGGHMVLQSLAALLMVAIGLYLAGWFPKFAFVERIGIPLWRRLEPLGRHLLPVRSPLHALVFGWVWGWLPCGLVYSALLLSLTADSTADGALFMLGFGLGTLPAMTGVGMLAQSLLRLGRAPSARQAAGVALIILALAGLLFGPLFHRSAPAFLHPDNVSCIR